MSATPFGADIHAGTAAAGFRAGPKTPDTLALVVCPGSRRVHRAPRSGAILDHPKDHLERYYEAPERSPFHAGIVHDRATRVPVALYIGQALMAPRTGRALFTDANPHLRLEWAVRAVGVCGGHVRAGRGVRPRRGALSATAPGGRTHRGAAPALAWNARLPRARARGHDPRTRGLPYRVGTDGLPHRSGALRMPTRV